MFFDEDGKMIDYDKFMNRVWKKAFEKAGLSYRGSHNMRHTYANIRLSNGDPLHEVAKELGHSSSAITEKHYFKWIPKESKTDLSTLDDEPIKVIENESKGQVG